MLRKTSLYTALTIAVMSTLLLMSYAVLQYIPQGGVGEALLIRAPRLTTDVWGVFNPHTGELRYGSKVEEIHPIASITKLMTAYAVMKTGTEETMTTIMRSDIMTEGRAGKLTYGTETSLRELLFPLLIESSNDSGAIIERVLGISFKETVATLLYEQDLLSTTIVDPTGLSVENVSTVRDLAHLYVYLDVQYPYITDITQLRMYLNGKTGLLNNNPVRVLEEYTGGKHGFTPEAGRTFVGTVTLPDERGEIGIVLLGSKNLLADVKQIIESFN